MKLSIAARALLSAALLAFTLTLATPPPAQAADYYTKSVSVTSTNATTTFTKPAYTVDIVNYGSAAVFANLGGAAVSDGSDTVSMSIGVCEAHHFEFPAGHSVAAVGLKTASSTATVQLTGSSIVPPVSQVFRHTVTNFCATGGGTAPTFTTGTFSSNVTVGGTLGVTGVATFTAQPIFSSTTASRIALTDASKGIVSNGAITTNALPKSASSGASLSASAVSDDGTTVTSSEPVSVTGAVTTSAQFITTPTAQTVASDGAGTAAAFNIAATVGVVLVTCNDTDGCAGTLLETSAVSGSFLTIVNMSANAVTLADSAGVSETAGALSLGQYDSVRYVYASDRWVELSLSNN